MRIKINIQTYTRNIKTKVTNNKINDGNDGRKKMLLDLETKIQIKIGEIVEVYKEILLLSKVFPDDGNFKIALLREKSD